MSLHRRKERERVRFHAECYEILATHEPLLVYHAAPGDEPHAHELSASGALGRAVPMSPAMWARHCTARREAQL